MILSFPLLKYLIRTAMFLLRHSAFRAKVLKILRTTSSSNEFRTSSKAFLNRDHKQCGNTVVLKRTLSNFFCRYFEVFQKLNDTSITFISFLFD